MEDSFNPIREIPNPNGFTSEDTLVVFGELFNRGYANGVIDEALKSGMKVIYSTVGRREKDNTLRPLNDEELEAKGHELINIPLEAGFDLEAVDGLPSPVDQLKGYGLKGWEEARLDWGAIEKSKAQGRTRFRKNLQAFLKQICETHRPKGRLVFLHTMAGGFPRAKVVMPIANKVFKGSGERFLSSQLFWESEIGQLCDQSFNEVTAETFAMLVEETQNFGPDLNPSGKEISYLAFGYHGNEVWAGDEFKWYSYSPYLQGWAKLLLEKRASEAWEKSIKASVFNVPEILTDSSSLFLGIEVVLYPLLSALVQSAPEAPLTKSLLKSCEEKLNPGNSFEDIHKLAQSFLTNPEVINYPSLESWPQHNAPKQAELMREHSQAIIKLHKNPKDLLTKDLSEVVFQAVGKIMLDRAYEPKAPVQWIGHDLVVKMALHSDS